MYKNEAGQSVRLFAFNTVTNAPVTGDALNITCKVSRNSGALVATETLNPTEQEDGYYLLPLSQVETNADTLDFFPDSATPNVVVIVPNFDRQTIDRQTPAAAEAAASGAVDVEAAAADPASTTIDGVSVTNRSINEQIAADRHVAAKAAASNNIFGMAFRRVNPGSAVRD